MTPALKSTIRHILTALGTLIAVFGLNQFVGIFEIVDVQFDAVWAALQTIIGFGVTILGFFRNKDRLSEDK